MRLLILISFVCIAFQLNAQVNIKEILAAPFASDLTVSIGGDTIAWIDNTAGERNIFMATGKDFSTVQQLTDYFGDEGIALGNLHFSANAEQLVYVRGNSKNRRGEAANPGLVQEETEETIYVLQIADSSISKISTGIQPRISKDGRTLAFIKNSQIWTASLMDSVPNPQRLFKTRGSQTNIKWSPNGNHIAFTSRRGDHSYIGVFNIEKRKLSYMDPSVDHDFSPEWSPDNTRLAYIRRPNAKHIPPFTPQRAAHPWSIRILDIDKGKANTIWTADEGIGSVYFSSFPSTALEWASGHELIFPWEKEGWMHLYALDISTGTSTLLTVGKGIVEDYYLSEDKQSLYYTTNINDLHRRHIGKVDLKSKQTSMLTSGLGVEYGPRPSSYGPVFLHTKANHTARPALLSDGAIHLIGDRTKVFSWMKTPELVEINATDGQSFQGTIFYPKNYDPKKEYPAVIFLHGGSRRQMLLTHHYSGYYSNAFALQQYFSNNGYLALSINYRSGIGYGMEFREAENYGITGASEVYDLIGSGVYLAERNDVDKERIALWGGSYGGYLTAHGLAKRSDLFAVGVDIHGVHNWNTELPTFATWYDKTRFPEIAELAYSSSPEAYLDGWRSPVLLIHGDDDRNVPFAESVVLSEQLRDRGVYFEQLIFPDEVHGFLLHDNWVKAQEATFEFIHRFIGIDGQ